MEDVVKEDIDVAIRIGRVKNEGLVAIPPGITERRVYAATAYLERHGTPTSPEQLQAHDLIGFTLPATAVRAFVHFLQQALAPEQRATG